MAQTVGGELTESEERSGQQERVLDTLHASAQKIIHELGIIREATMRTNKELVAMGQKLTGLGKHESGVMEIANALVRNYTDPETRRRTMVRTNLPKMPYLGELK